jgi:hypothetical protein
MTKNNDKRSGLAKGLVTFRFVETEAEYQCVLGLRFREYSAAGKVAADKTLIDMGDAFDARSKIVIGLYQNEIVASIRMIIHTETDQLEQEQFINWPSMAPRRDQLVEATRACVRQDFRGTDLFLSMLTFFGQEAMKLGKKFVVLCASEEMARFYQRAGAKPMGLSYAHAALNGKIHHVLVVDIYKVFLGQGVNPLSWNLMWGNIYRDPKYRAGIRISLWDRLRIFTYSLLRGLSEGYLKRRLRRKPVRRKVAVYSALSSVNLYWEMNHENA